MYKYIFIILCVLIIGCNCNRDFSGSVKVCSTNGKIDFVEVRFPDSSNMSVRLHNSEEIDRAIAQTEFFLSSLKDARKTLQLKELP